MVMVMVMVMVMSTPLQALHSREEEGEKAKYCQQKLQENVWKVNFSSNVKQTETDKKEKNNFHPELSKLSASFAKISKT